MPEALDGAVNLTRNGDKEFPVLQARTGEPSRRTSADTEGLHKGFTHGLRSDR
jgi:hypothetical protein